MYVANFPLTKGAGGGFLFNLLILTKKNPSTPFKKWGITTVLLKINLYN